MPQNCTTPALGEDHERILNAIPALAWSAQVDGAAHFFNQPWLDYSGMSLDQAVDWGWTTVLHPDDESSVLDHWRSVLTSGQRCEIEMRMRRFDGEYRWFLVRANPCFEESGRILRWYGTSTDIEDLRRAEQSRRASEDHIREIVDSIPGHVFTYTPSGETEFVNRPLLEYFGLALEDLQAWRTTGGGGIHPDDLERVAGEWRRNIHAQTAYVLDMRLRRADGVYRWFQLRVAPRWGAGGRLVRWYGIANDIDDIKRAEETLRSSEQDMRLLVDSIPGMIAIRTISGEVEFVNRRLLEYFGQSLEEAQAWKTNDNIHPDDRDRTVDLWLKASETELGYESEARLLRADGVYRWCNFRTVPSRDAPGRLLRWYCLINDIDDLKRAEETLRTTQARLTRATHFAALSELAASIAHEINQPLTAVVANGHACRKWLSEDATNLDRARLSAERIIRDGNSAAEVVRRIRSMFKHAPIVKRALNVNDVIKEVCDLMSDDLLGRAIVLRSHLETDLPRSFADRVQLQQVLTNLIRNGIEAMESVNGRAKVLTISSRRDGEEILVDVADSGMGISDGEAIFESFRTTKPNGMGMGLPICRSIIEAHGGRLWATNDPSSGARFTFALGAAAEDAST